MNHSALVAAAALVVIVAVAWLSTTLAERRRRVLQARLAAIVGAGPQPGAQADGSVSLRRPRQTGRAQGLGLLPARLHRRLTDALGATGDRLGMLQLVIAALVGALLAAGLLVAVLGWPMLITVPLVLAGGIAAAMVRLHAAQHRFQQSFVDLFPETLDVIVRAVRAGLPVLDAIEAAVSNVPEPVAGELRKLLDELRIGIDLELALAHATNRIRVNDFRFFAATLVLQRRTGGSLADTLANLAGLIRRRKEIRLRASALSAESRATAYVIGALPFVMVGIMYLINPGLISLLFTDHRGKIMLGIAIIMMLSGFAVMRTMINRASR